VAANRQHSLPDLHKVLSSVRAKSVYQAVGKALQTFRANSSTAAADKRRSSDGRSRRTFVSGEGKARRCVDSIQQPQSCRARSQDGASVKAHSTMTARVERSVGLSAAAVRLFASNIARMLVFAQADEAGMPEVVVACPFEELKLPHELRL
jgi:hypothetical protein